MNGCWLACPSVLNRLGDHSTDHNENGICMYFFVEVLEKIKFVEILEGS